MSTPTALRPLEEMIERWRKKLEYGGDWKADVDYRRWSEEARSSCADELASALPEIERLLGERVAAARSETLAEAAKIARDAERLHGVTFGTIPALILNARSRDTTHLSEIRELETRIAEAKWWFGRTDTDEHEFHRRIADLEQQLESLRSGKGENVKVVEAGHRYLLKRIDDDYTESLEFVKREGPKYPGNVGHHGGTTTQEVLRALIDRAGYVNRQIPCWQTKISIFLMGLVIWLYEHRAAKRHGRKSPSFHDATFGTCCKECGHVGCLESLRGREKG